jgi:hypothetical protein
VVPSQCNFIVVSGQLKVQFMVIVLQRTVMNVDKVLEVCFDHSGTADKSNCTRITGTAYQQKLLYTFRQHGENVLDIPHTVVTPCINFFIS